MSNDRVRDRVSFPQAPFLPVWDPLGPTFLDTEACLCGLRTSPEDGSNNAAWQCIGNQTQNLYVVNSGKWFHTANGGTNVNLSIHDASNPPQVDRPLLFNQNARSFTPLTEERQKSMTVWDRHCTGQNHSTFSTAFYRSWTAYQENQVPFDGFPCWRPDALLLPVRLQSPEDWLKNGCREGFLCTLPLSSLPYPKTLRGLTD